MDKQEFTEWLAEMDELRKGTDATRVEAGLFSNRKLIERVLESWRADLEIEKDNLAQRIGLINKALRRP